MSMKPDAMKPSQPASSEGPGVQSTVRRAADARESSDPRDADTVAPPARSGVSHAIPIPKAPAVPGF